MSNGDFPLPGQVGEHFLRLARQPRNIGSIENPSGKGIAVGQCGDCIEVFLQITGGVIADIRVAPRGCVYTLVCASVMSELVKGRDLDEALYLDPDEIAAALGGLPEDHMHCARLAVNTLGEAIDDYYKRPFRPE
ncbi:MAG: iron-sulfur cluster assembly scaffold protein [Syntrophobacteraceae bacterium]